MKTFYQLFLKQVTVRRQTFLQALWEISEGIPEHIKRNRFNFTSNTIYQLIHREDHICRLVNTAAKI